MDYAVNRGVGVSVLRDTTRRRLPGCLIDGEVVCCDEILRKTRPGVRLNEHMEHPDWLKFKNPQAPAVKREAEEDWGQ